MPTTRNPIEIVSGLFLIATAILFWWLGRPLRLGTITQMGPGYAPALLCSLQLMLGLAVLAIGLTKDGDRYEAVSWRPMLIILASVLFFALAVERIGLPLATIGTVVLAGLATPLSRHWQNAILGAFLALFAVLVFVKSLGLQIPVWPAGWGR